MVSSREAVEDGATGQVSKFDLCAHAGGGSVRAVAGHPRTITAMAWSARGTPATA